MTHRYLKGNFFLLKLEDLPTLEWSMNYYDNKGIFNNDIKFITSFFLLNILKWNMQLKLYCSLMIFCFHCQL